MARCHGGEQGQALEYMFKKIPFTTNNTLASRKIALRAFQETLKKNYKEKPDDTLSLINSFFEDKGNILSEDSYSYMRTMFISLFEEIKLDKENLSKKTQDILYPEKPKKIQLAVSAFIKEAKP